MKVLLLGATGMVGRNLYGVLTSNDINVVTVGRSSTNHIISDFLQDPFEKLITLARDIKPDYVVNLAGMIKQSIHTQEDGQKAVQLNSILPSILEIATNETGSRVITVATDCVFSGLSGNYKENSIKDGSDVYALTKNLGEHLSPNTMHLRSSIVGFGRDASGSLFDWYCSLPTEKTCDGYVNHFWNGITNLASSRIILGVIKNDLFEAGQFHIIPSNVVTKFELLSTLRVKLLNRTSEINPVPSENHINRSLATNNPTLNAQIWNSAGYSSIPDIETLIAELVNEEKCYVR
jgi:dTDP-4-dehydrorhamnose reductase